MGTKATPSEGLAARTISGQKKCLAFIQTGGLCYLD